MKTDGENSIMLSGMLDKNHHLAYYPKKGITVIRRNPIGKKLSDLPDKQQKSFIRFRCIQIFTQNHMRSIVRPIWNKFYDNGYNAFIKNNKHAFDENGNLAYHNLLKVAAGKLPEPIEMQALFLEEEQMINIKWNKDNRLSNAFDNDRLYYALVEKNNSIKLFNTRAVRKDYETLINVPRKLRESEYIFLFLSNPSQKEYSNSQVFKLK